MGKRRGWARPSKRAFAAAAPATAGAALVHRRDRTSAADLRRAGRGGAIHTVVTADGVKLYAEVDGPEDAPVTVVFAHSWTLDLTAWRHQRAALAASGIRCVFFDQRGHGMSDRGPEDTSGVRPLAADLHAVLDELALGRPAVLVGHSMGAMAILALAGEHPELFGPRVKAAVLLAGSAGGLDRVAVGLPSWLGRGLHRWFPALVAFVGRHPALFHMLGLTPYVWIARHFLCDRSAGTETVRTCAVLTSAAPMDVISEFVRARREHDERAALPVLNRLERVFLLAGETDKLVPISHARALAEGIPVAESVMIADCGHMIPLEHPHVVNRYLAEAIAAAGASLTAAGAEGANRPSRHP